MITPLQKVLLLRPVTYLLRGKPVATDHIVAGDGVTLEADDAVDRVLVKVDGKTVYRVAYANVAGDVPAETETENPYRIGGGCPVCGGRFESLGCLSGHVAYLSSHPTGLLTEEGKAKVAAGEPIDPMPPGLDVAKPSPPPDGEKAPNTSESDWSGRRLNKAERKALKAQREGK